MRLLHGGNTEKRMVVTQMVGTPRFELGPSADERFHRAPQLCRI